MIPNYSWWWKLRKTVKSSWASVLLVCLLCRMCLWLKRRYVMIIKAFSIGCGLGDADSFMWGPEQSSKVKIWWRCEGQKKMEGSSPPCKDFLQFGGHWEISFFVEWMILKTIFYSKWVVWKCFCEAVYTIR